MKEKGKAEGGLTKRATDSGTGDPSDRGYTEDMVVGPIIVDRGGRFSKEFWAKEQESNR